MEHLTSLSPRDRFNMISMGMNPLNPEHVDKYRKGQRVDVNENIERVKAHLTDEHGNSMVNKSLGHSNHRDFTPKQGEYNPAQYSSMEKDTVDPRSAMMQDMEDYGSGAGFQYNTNDYFDASSKLMSFNEAPKPKQKMNLNEVQQRGQKLSVDYFNAFIKSLQNPSTKANVEVYKALKSLLEFEKKLQGSQALAPFQKSVRNVTAKMYQQLKG